MRKVGKRILSGMAGGLAVILGVGAVLHTSVTVEASLKMMPGIEHIVSETSQEEPFRILEIVDNKEEAEIGYYVSGQEPYHKFYQYTANGNTYTFSSVSQALSVLPTLEQRQEFMENIRYLRDDSGNLVPGDNGTPKIDQNGSGFRDLSGLVPDNTVTDVGNVEETYPFSYEPYEESYFPEDETVWNRVELNEKRISQIQGHYEYQSDGTGDYTKGEDAYHPIRQDSLEDQSQTDKYRENIRGFYYDEGAQAPYLLEFEAVQNSRVNNALNSKDNLSPEDIQAEYNPAAGGYGYYENVYEALTKEIAKNLTKPEAEGGPVYSFPGESFSIPTPTPILIAENTVNSVTARARESFESGTDSYYMDVPEETGEDVVDVTGEENEEIQGGEKDAFPASDGETSGEPSGEDPFSSGQEQDGSTGFFAGNVQSQEEAFEKGVSQVSFTENLIAVDAVAADAFGSGTQEPSQEDPFSDSQDTGGGAGEGETQPQGPADGAGEGEAQPTDMADGAGEGETQPTDMADGAHEGETQPSQGEDPFGEGEEIPVEDTQVQESLTDGDMLLAQAGESAEYDHGTIRNEDTAGTQANPYIYLGTAISEFPNYTYEGIGDLAYVMAKAEEKKAADANLLALGQTPQRVNDDITLEEDGHYYIWRAEVEGTLQKHALSLVTGRQMVEEKDVKAVPETLLYDYYYRVKRVYFCCRNGNAQTDGGTSADFAFYGWYYPHYQQGDVYVPVKDGEAATYYRAQETYTLTPGTGNYRFQEDKGETPKAVEIDHLYYRGGYKNHDWLKRYVFHLTPEEDGEEFENFSIQVDTLTAKEFEDRGTDSPNTENVSLSGGETWSSGSEMTGPVFEDGSFDGTAEEAAVISGVETGPV